MRNKIDIMKKKIRLKGGSLRKVKTALKNSRQGEEKWATSKSWTMKIVTGNMVRSK